MIIVVCRKGMKGNVRENVLEYHTGAINIRESRIPLLLGEDTSVAPSKSKDPDKRGSGGWKNTSEYTGSMDDNWKRGRWPANVLLTEKSKQELDDFSGISKSGFASQNSRGWGVGNDVSLTKWESHDSCGYGDVGGASKYFMTLDTEEELVEYLHKMITPTHVGGSCLTLLQKLEEHNFQEYPDNHWDALLLRGVPDKELSEEIHRVAKPGAFVLLMSTKEEPTAAIGACNLEDAGFEIRDSIFYVDKDNPSYRLHKKASKSERTKGTGHINFGGLDHGNFHPTVKPIGIMEWLLEDLPVDNTVIDPFLGSGTTGVACAKTGHDFIGIEMDPQYVQICDARIRYWNKHYNAWNPIPISSEVEREEEKRESFSFEDFFDLK